jgi:PPP family 3-phenylpropionic acid transporter
MALPFFLTYIVYAVITPYLPLLLRGLGYSPSLVGLLLGLYEGAGIAGPFIFGHFADKMGRYKPGLMITNGLVLFAAIPLTLFHNPLISVLLMLIMGLGFRSALPLLEAVTTIGIGKNGNYGKIRTFGSVSFILTTLFLQSALVLPPDKPSNIAIWITMSTALTMISMIFIPRSYEKNGSLGNSPVEKGPGETGGRGIWSAMLILGLIIMGLNRLGMSAVYGFFSLYLNESIHWDAVGLMWALASTAEVPFMFLSRRIIRRFGAFNCLSIATGTLILRLLLYAFVPVKPGIIAAQLLHAFCFGIFHPAAVSFITTAVPPERRALGMTLYLSLGSGLPTFLGNILGGFIVEHAGYQALFSTFAIFPAIAVVLYAAVLVIQKRGKMPVNSQATSQRFPG